jgi:MSHA biogenesis protein MshP
MTYRTLKKSAGVALVTAIFLLVVLAGLAVAVVSLTTSQQATEVQDIQGARAYQAAKAGIEWALYIALEKSDLAPPALVTADAALGCVQGGSGSTYGFAMPAGTTLSAFTVTVTCEAAAPSLAPVGYTGPDTTRGHFRITSIACNEPANNACPNTNPGPDYVERRITAQL